MSDAHPPRKRPPGWAWLPDAHFGSVGAPLPDHRQAPDDGDDDDEDAPVPEDVAALLGFNPDDVDGFNDADAPEGGDGAE